ncbi:MAG: hypothetical protein PGN09_01020 [Sphingomonas fennica]
MGWVRELVPARNRTAIVWIAIALIAGIVVKLGWALTRARYFGTGEASYIALALAEGRGFADGFVAGQGPTAHLLPVSPAIAGAVYWLLGPRSMAAEVVLFLWAIGLAAFCYVIFARVALRLGVPRGWALAALLFLWGVPIYTSAEVFDFRVWEGALALALGSALLFLVVRADAGERPRGFLFWLSVLPAATFFVNGPVGLAAVAAWGLFLWRNRRAVPVFRVMVATAAALVLIVAPWTARNWIVMGHPILLRDNLGMELAVANHPGAVDPADPAEAFRERLVAIQPYLHPGAYARLQAAGGEVAYSKQLGAEAKAWMAANPRAVARLWTTHVREMLFTRSWMFKTRKSVALPLVRSAIMTFVGLAALLGLALAAVRRDGRYFYMAAFAIVPVLVYVPFQPIPRYTWLIYPALTCMATDALARAAAAVRRRRAAARTGVAPRRDLPAHG